MPYFRIFSTYGATFMGAYPADLIAAFAHYASAWGVSVEFGYFLHHVDHSLMSGCLRGFDRHYPGIVAT